MATHMVYPKIHALHKEECEGILKGECVIQEKIDGANLSIWMEDGEMYIGSRTQIVGGPHQKEGFRGAVEYCMAHKGIRKILDRNPSARLFGEWLVKHTIKYPDEYCNKFYLYDMYDHSLDEWLDPVGVTILAEANGICYPTVFAVKENPSLEDIRQYAGRSFLGDITGEGVVVKNPGFINKFGNRAYGKYVIESFKEKNQIVFGNHSSNDLEMKFVTENVTLPRIMKIINKIEQNTGERIDKRHTPQIMGMVYNDIFTEELWGFAKKHKPTAFDLKRLEDLSNKRSRIMFFDILDNNIEIYANTHNA